MTNKPQPKTKIIFVSDAIYPFNKGGKEKRLYDISTRLVENHYDVHVYTMKWWSGENTYYSEGVVFHALCRKRPLYSGRRRSISEGIIFGLSCLKLISEDWDIIDVDHMPFIPLYFVKLVCLLKGKKMFATWHEVWGKQYWKEYLGVFGNLAYLIEKWSISLPNRIISVSGLTTNSLKNNMFTKNHIITIPDGISSKHIKDVAGSSTLSDVIFAGRLLAHKNVEILIRSIYILKEKFPEIKCLIIGDGPEKAHLERIVTDLGLTNNISFLGFLENHDDVYSLIKSSKVFVLPSVREGFGIVVAEANACGVPVITIDNDANAAKDLIHEGKNGFCCPLIDVSIADRISSVLESSNTEETKKYCDAVSTKYDWDEVMFALESVYQK